VSAVATGRAEALEEFGRSFRAALAAVRRLRGRETNRPGRLSHAQYSLLFGLADAETLSVRDLALCADLAPATVTQMLDALAGDGLVERVRSEHDKRVVLTSLTERGEALVAERRARFEQRWTDALAEFSDAELRTSAAVLGRLHDHFDEIAEEPEP
jgi:DNA-binding MarR family transcriptional regulator